VRPVLTRDHRLTSSQDFSRAVRDGRRAGSGRMVVHLALRAADERRAGFVVSRAVGAAVTRNRVKRRLRHLVRDRLDRVPPGGLLVVRALPAAAGASPAQLAADLDRLLRRVTQVGGRR
jgi:ribonuclease P protein component